MLIQNFAYREIEKLVKSFKNLPASQRNGMNEMQTRLGRVKGDGEFGKSGISV